MALSSKLNGAIIRQKKWLTPLASVELVPRTVLCLVSLWFALAVGPQQDYVAFLKIWSRVLEGQDPYANDPLAINAYGPAFNVFSALVLIHPLAPKFFFTLVWMLVDLYLVRLVRGRDLEGQRILSVHLVLVANPYFWIEIPYYGHFDIVVAACCLGAVHCCAAGRHVASGLLLGIGILLKFFPLALLPFLVMDRKQFRPRLLVATVGMVAYGMSMGYAYWGGAVFSPLSYAVQRGASGASIFNDVPFLAERFHVDLAPIMSMSLPLLTGAGATLFVVAWMCWLDSKTSSVLAGLLVLMFYKVAHPQFFTLPIVLLVYWFTTRDKPASREMQLRAATGCYVIWLAYYNISWARSNEVFPSWPLSGVFTFVAAFWVIIEILRSGSGRIDTNPARSRSE
jgi:hypothetical protein